MGAGFPKSGPGFTPCDPQVHTGCVAGTLGMESTVFHRLERMTRSFPVKTAHYSPCRFEPFPEGSGGFDPLPTGLVPQRRSEASGPVPQSRDRDLSAGCRCSCQGTDPFSPSSSSAAGAKGETSKFLGCSTGKDPFMSCLA